jgi:hypothetical protein
VLYVLRFLAFDYPFGIFKLFFLNTIVLWITVGQYLYILLTDTVLLSRPKSKRTKGKKESTKHYTFSKRSSKKDPTKNGGELRFSKRVSSSCSTCGSSRATLVANQVIGHE